MSADDPHKPDQPIIVITRRSLRRAGLIVLAVLVVVGVGLGAFFAGRSSAPSSRTFRSSVSALGIRKSSTQKKTTTTTTAPHVVTTTTTLPPVPTTTVPPTPTTTNPELAVLSPASVPPAVPECNEAIQTSADGNASPLLCPNGGPNVAAWNWYARSYGAILGLGPSSPEATTIATMCRASVPYSEVQEASRLAAAYYGWPYANDPSFSTWDINRSADCTG